MYLLVQVCHLHIIYHHIFEFLYPKYCFYITVDNILDLESYKEFVLKLSNSFNNIEQVSVIFNPINTNYEYLIDYFNEIINSENDSILSMFINDKIDFSDDSITIYTSNDAESKKINEYKLKIEEKLNKVGYKNI